MRTRALVILALLTPSAAWALPPPKPEADMLKQADLVVDASCVKVSCDGAPITQPDKVITKYVSTLFPSKSEKGGLPNSFQIRGEDWAWTKPAPVGGWHQGPVPEGWAGKLYLEKMADGTYTKIWWNAMIEDKAASNPHPLPSCANNDGGPPVKDSGPGQDSGPPVKDSGPGQDSSPIGDAQLVDASTDSAPAADSSAPDSSPGADSGPAVESDDGCSCRVGSEPAATGQMALAILLLGLLARRRRPGQD